MQVDDPLVPVTQRYTPEELEALARELMLQHPELAAALGSEELPQAYGAVPVDAAASAAGVMAEGGQHYIPREHIDSTDWAPDLLYQAGKRASPKVLAIALKLLTRGRGRTIMPRIGMGVER